MSDKLQNTKWIIEIIAIICAGVFAFFTWGLDYLNQNQPNWNLELKDISQYPAKNVNGINLICNDSNCTDPDVCLFSGTLSITNNGNRPLNIGDTKIYIYFIPRFTNDSSGIIHTSTYEYLSKTAEIDKINGIEVADSLSVIGIDSLPVYPGREAWRPFSLEINPSMLRSVDISLKEFAERYVLLISIEQNITVRERFIFNRDEVSKLVYLHQAICYMRNFVSDKK